MGYIKLVCKYGLMAFAHGIANEAVTIRSPTCYFNSSEGIVPSIAVIPNMPLITAVLALALAALATHGFFRLRGTTLAAPCLWVAVAAISLAVGTLVDSHLKGISLSATRFAIACTTLCPLMAVLGAKSPQDRGWQWVVLTLWIVLVWPAAQALALPAGVRVELFVAWKLFLWGLIFVGLLNYVPTRHWRAAILVALGQIMLLREHLGLPAADSVSVNQLVAVLSFLSAVALVASNRIAASEPTASKIELLNAKWLEFRDFFGAFWALRLLGRINQSAEARDWPLRLTWSGFTDPNEALHDSQYAEIEQAMHAVLRRFISVANDSADSNFTDP